MTTNWEKYFGTPEKAAETVVNISYACDVHDCRKCPLRWENCDSPRMLAEWLESEAGE